MSSRARTQPLTVEEPEAAQPSWRQPRPLAPVPQRPPTKPLRPATAAAHGQPRDAVRWRIAVPWRQLTALLLAAIAAAGLALLWTSDLFRVNPAQTQVRGNQRVPTQAIYAAADLDGLSVFQVRPEAVAAHVRRVAGIESSRVHVRLPSQVIIEVVERTPLVAWRAITQTIWLDERGEIVPATGPQPPLTLVDEEGAAAQREGRLAPDILASLREIHALRPDLGEIHYRTLEGLYFRDAESWTVYLGRDGSMARKLGLLEAARPELRTRRPTPQTVDLRFGDAALIR